MAYFDAEQTAVDYIDSLGLADAGVNLFKGPAREAQEGVPKNATFVVAHDGPMFDRYMGTKHAGIARCQVEILVRASPEKREEGRERALALLDAFRDDATLAIVGCQILESAPRYLERDRAQNHLWLVKVELIDRVE
jgi:hypothetical protein